MGDTECIDEYCIGKALKERAGIKTDVWIWCS